MVDAAPTAPKSTTQYAFQKPDMLPADMIAALGVESAQCERCDHACHATQTVSGGGPANARLKIVGEQPGDREDIEGRVIAGPAGEVFDAALDEAKLSRKDLYITNAVKPFHSTPKGKNRIHMTPKITHIDQCRWWLNAQRELVKPALTLAMGTVRRDHSTSERTMTPDRQPILPLDASTAIRELGVVRSEGRKRRSPDRMKQTRKVCFGRPSTDNSRAHRIPDTCKSKMDRID